MTKNNEIVEVVTNGIIALWKSYKQTNRTRFESPGETFMKGLFGIEADDGDAAMCLVQDVTKITRKVKTDREFKSIVKNSY